MAAARPSRLRLAGHEPRTTCTKGKQPRYCSMLQKSCKSLLVYRLVHAPVILPDRAKAGFDSPTESLCKTMHAFFWFRKSYLGIKLYVASLAEHSPPAASTNITSVFEAFEGSGRALPQQMTELCESSLYGLVFPHSHPCRARRRRAFVVHRSKPPLRLATSRNLVL